MPRSVCHQFGNHKAESLAHFGWQKTFVREYLAAHLQGLQYGFG